MKPKTSVVIPTYNEAANISKSLASLKRAVKMAQIQLADEMPQVIIYIVDGAIWHNGIIAACPSEI